MIESAGEKKEADDARRKARESDETALPVDGATVAS